MPVMLAIHGGGYFFGSINTHRYVYWRLVRLLLALCPHPLLTIFPFFHRLARPVAASSPSSTASLLNILSPVAVRFRFSCPFWCSTHRLLSTVHDCLSSYLYLIRPPPGAKHKAVDPSRITICGDSAGGGMTLALLCLLRDTGLPMPAGGASLISSSLF
jgi:acetyl esterase/lipase